MHPCNLLRRSSRRSAKRAPGGLSVVSPVVIGGLVLTLLALSPDSARAQSTEGGGDLSATTPVLLPPSDPAPSSPYTPPQSQPTFDRSGWFFGAAFGVGSIGYTGGNVEEESGSGGFFFDARFGGMLSRRFALAVEFWSDGHREQNGQFDEARTQNTFSITGTFWAAPRLWIKGGIGAATLTFHQFDDNIAVDGNAYQAAIGYEFLQRGPWVFDGALRITASSFDDFGTSFGRSAFSISLGVSRF